MDTKKQLEDFYNYKNWRDIQRNQLALSANLYFVFSFAIIGYIVNFFIENEISIENCEKHILTTSLVFLFISLFYYVRFTDNRLKDYQETAQLIYKEKNVTEIKNLTAEVGIRTWKYYRCQRLTLILGFIFSLIGFSIYKY